MSLRSVQLSCLALAALACGCAKKTPPTQHIEMSPEIIRIVREREPETAPTELAPGGRDLTTDPEADKTSSVAPTVFGVAFGGSSPPWHCFDQKFEGVDLGFCGSTSKDCERWRARGKKEGSSVSACYEQPRAACFYFEDLLRERHGYGCYPKFELCDAWQANFAGDREYQNVGPCKARRIVDTLGT